MAGILGNFDIYRSGAKPVPMPTYSIEFPFTDSFGYTWTEEKWKEKQRRMNEAFTKKMEFPFTDTFGRTWTEEEWKESKRKERERKEAYKKRVGLPPWLSLMSNSVVSRPNVSPRYYRR